MRVLPLLLLAACADQRVDVVGPFTGEARRFVVDSIDLAESTSQATEYGGLIDDNDVIDNQLANVIRTLATQGDVTSYGHDMIAGGSIASSVIITADDFANDDSVSVLYLGSDDETGVAVGGTLAGGELVPNRTRYTKMPGSATLHLPVFVDADASIVPVIGLEIELTADGAGGFDAEIHGGVPTDALMEAAYLGITQMVANNPAMHPVLLPLFDSDRDGVITRDELRSSSLMVSLLSFDVMYDGQPVQSFGFRAHLTPCAEGRCSAPVASCFDRVQDGDESHVDCGGGCRGCLEGATCSAPSDCESVDCTDGACGPPSCDNGVRDGLETDIDCGHVCGRGCGTGQRCFGGDDCRSGTCGAPCDPDTLFCGDFDFSTCR